MISKYPCYPNIHDVQMSMMWSHLSRVMTLMICGHTCHMWANLSQWSHVVTQCQNFHMCPKLMKKKICSHRPYGCAEGKNDEKSSALHICQVNLLILSQNIARVSVPDIGLGRD